MTYKQIKVWFSANTNKSALKQLLALWLFTLLLACGGGGESETPVLDNQQPNNPSPAEPMSFNTVLKRSETSNLQVSHGYTEYNDDQGLIASMAAGVTVGDYDNDGDLDIFIVRGDIGPDLLFANNGKGQFTDVTQQAGLPYNEMHQHSGPLFADFNGDGHLDLFVGAINGEPVKVYQNDGAGHFTDVTAGSGLAALMASQTISAAAGDYDNDGDIDLALSHWGSDLNVQSMSTEYLWQNVSENGAITFQDASVEAGLTIDLLRSTNGALGTDHDYSFSPALVDINQDGHADLLMASDYGGSQIFLNNTDGTFTDVTDTDVISDSDDMGSVLADFDNDGDLDWFVSAIYGKLKNGNHLYQNDSGEFTNVSRTANIMQGGWGWAGCAADFNGDQLLDIFQTNGSFTIDLFDDGHANDPSVLFVNSPGLTFSEQAANAGVQDFEQGRGVVCADINGDNKPDILLTTKHPTDSVYLYLNQIEHNNWLRVFLRGKGDNTQALGAVIKVTVDDVTQTRVVNLASQYVSHAPTAQLFGLGESDRVDSLEVIWPDGTVQFQYNLTAGEVIIQQP